MSFRTLISAVLVVVLCTACEQRPAQPEPSADPYLAELADSLWNTTFKDPRHAMRLAQELDELAERAKHHRGRLQANNGMAEAYYALQLLDSSNYWYRVSLRHAMDAGDLRNSCIIHGAIGTNFMELGRYDSCMQHMHAALSIGEQLQDSVLICSAVGRMGKAQRVMYHQTDAIRSLQRALTYCNTDASQNEYALALLALAILHDEQGDHSTALDHAYEAQRSFAEQGDDWNLVPTLNTIGSIRYAMRDTAGARTALLEARRLALEQGNLRIFASTSYNIATQLLEAGKADSARIIAEELLVQARTTGDQQDLSAGLTALGHAYFDLGDLAAARDTLRRALGAAQRSADLRMLNAGNRLLARTYAALGDHGKAWDAINAHMRYKDSLYTVEKTAEIDRLQAEFESAKKDQHIADLQDRGVLVKARNQWLRIGIGALALAACLIVVILLQKRRKDVAALNARLALERAEKDRLDEQLDHKRRELTAKALHLAQKNELLQDLKEQLSAIRADNSESALQQIGNSIRFDEQIDQNWDQFTIAFTETNAGFFDRLRAAQPDISKSELRLAALLSMNLNSKEIGAILNISDEGVRKGRYRLRKKLGLETSDGLEQHLARL